MSMSRREFVAAGAAALAWPEEIERLRERCAAAQDPWPGVRNEFLIPPGRIYLNVGTLGPQPRVVVDAVVESTRRVAETLPRGVNWDALKREIAALLHCDPAGLVFPRNTTEAMNFIANGLELRAGDEVVSTSHEHGGGISCWQLIARRHGVKLTQVDLGDPPLDAAAVLDRLTSALTARTRVLSISHVNFTNGLIMPVGELVQYCRPRGVVAVIDGAHPPGLMPVDLAALDPDFYATSPHKWLFAPQGCGVLYLRDEWRTRLWPTLAAENWDQVQLGAHRFNSLGTIDESRLAGLLAALHFHQAIGPERVYARHRQLRERVCNGLRALARVRLRSPLAGGAGLVAFVKEGVPSLELQTRLAEHNVRTRLVREYNYNWLRLSASIYNSPDQIDRVVELIDRG